MINEWLREHCSHKVISSFLPGFEDTTWWANPGGKSRSGFQFKVMDQGTPLGGARAHYDFADHSKIHWRLIQYHVRIINNVQQGYPCETCTTLGPLNCKISPEIVTCQLSEKEVLPNKRRICLQNLLTFSSLSTDGRLFKYAISPSSSWLKFTEIDVCSEQDWSPHSFQRERDFLSLGKHVWNWKGKERPC